MSPSAMSNARRPGSRIAAEYGEQRAGAATNVQYAILIRLAALLPAFDLLLAGSNRREKNGLVQQRAVVCMRPSLKLIAGVMLDALTGSVAGYHPVDQTSPGLRQERASRDNSERD